MVETQQDSRAEAKPKPTAGENSSTSSEGDGNSEASYTWSETSLVLDGEELGSAVERLHTIYRNELQTRCIPARSQVQSEARQRLTGDRLREWQIYEHEKTHERMDPDIVWGSITAQRNKDGCKTTATPHKATIRMLPMAYRAPKAQATHRFAAAALQSAVAQNSDSAQALSRAVAERLLALPQAQALSAEHDLVNTILLEETCKAFPPASRVDNRVSAQPEYRASARGTWQLHRELQRSGLPSLRNIWSRWRVFAQFMRASAMLRRQSRDLKRQFLTEQLQQAETAACKGNHRDLFLIARRLGPKPAQGVSRLQGPDGQVLDSRAEMAAIIKHSSEAFASTPDTTRLLPFEGNFTFAASDLQAALATLNIRKAVPRHIAPNAVWKLCATSISDRLGPCFEHHFRPESTDVLEGDMKEQWPSRFLNTLDPCLITCHSLLTVQGEE
ncbi:hypothetical protein AK812_SmicGene35683 [Symbiodinium microadriaticum]|uniref:Uncharacterized protein n=1 Tax=Symbiodinium microadriaticum TaxID=2951 RepID=A0A1Q9CKT8_SYMMI|nr:hypothetical protein AK812_SmicGene35683 [Symbiodinium microadriaticum]CAE7232793.1 unnamed protein product [Symbiodinium sp. KB8]CAE7238870.1 unnamed protein product [Symbiodinium microadriaticum]